MSKRILIADKIAPEGVAFLEDQPDQPRVAMGVQSGGDREVDLTRGVTLQFVGNPVGNQAQIHRVEHDLAAR